MLKIMGRFAQTGINYILKYIQMGEKKSAILNCNNVSQYYCF